MFRFFKEIVGSPAPIAGPSCPDGVALASSSMPPTFRSSQNGSGKDARRIPDSYESRLVDDAKACGLTERDDIRLINEVRQAVELSLTVGGGEMVIAVDGLAASGKSSNSARLARLISTPEFPCLHLSSGSLYRAVTVLAMRELRVSELTEELVLQNSALFERIARNLRFELRPNLAVAGGSQFFATASIWSRKLDLTDRLQSSETDRSVSFVAKMPVVRGAVNQLQRDFAHKHRLVVIDGRDAGTQVFPDAPLKVFLEVAPYEATRRALVRGGNQNPSQQEIQLALRDVNDRNRRDAAQTKIPPGAVRVDTTNLDSPSVLRNLLSLVAERALEAAVKRERNTFPDLTPLTFS